MDLDLLNVSFDPKIFTPHELEEVLEDPFAVRFLPDHDRDDCLTRFYAIGRTVSDRYLFIVFWTDGKIVRIIVARDASESERKFYERKYMSIC